MTRVRPGNRGWLAAALLVIVLGIALLYAYRNSSSVPAQSPAPTTAAIASPSPPVPSSSTPATSTPTSSASPSGTAEAPLPGTERFAIVVDQGCSPPGPPPFVRREDRDEVIATLGNGYLCQLRGAVSPDGRKLAYWLFENGRSEVALYQNGTTTTLFRLGDELLANLVWSSDGTGILFVAMKGGVQGVPPEYAALRTHDVASGSGSELLRERGVFFAPLAWDRGRRLTAATLTREPLAPSEYLEVTENNVVARYTLAAGISVAGASPDAALVIAQQTGVLRYWPIGSFADQKELRPEAGAGAGSVAWRPGSRELAVVVTNASSMRLELWSLDGARRRLVDFTGQRGGLFFRPDGSVIFLGGAVAIDVATGREARFVLAGSQRIAASVLR